MKDVYEAVVDDLTGSFEDAALFIAFCEEMKEKSYGVNETRQAFYFFKAGWLAYEATP